MMLHTPLYIASTTLPANTAPPKLLVRPGESIQITRVRLVYQSRRRGTLEHDLLLSTFTQEHLGTMDVKELSEFDKVRAFQVIWLNASLFLILFFPLAYRLIGLGCLLLGFGKTDAAWEMDGLETA